MPKTEAVKNKEAIEPAIKEIDSFLKKIGTEDFCKSERPEINNSESDDEPCCSKHIQRKREWQHEREILLARCKATENSQQVLRNVRGILEQLRKRYFLINLDYVNETLCGYNKLQYNNNDWQERN